MTWTGRKEVFAGQEDVVYCGSAMTVTEKVIRHLVDRMRMGMNDF